MPNTTFIPEGVLPHWMTNPKADGGEQRAGD